MWVWSSCQGRGQPSLSLWCRCDLSLGGGATPAASVVWAWPGSWGRGQLLPQPLLCSSALQRCSRVHEPAVPATRLTQVLLRGLVSSSRPAPSSHLCPLTCVLSPVSSLWPRRPSSLDAYAFGHLAPLLRCKLPSGKLQQHLKSLDNLSSFCTNVLLLYFPRDGPGEIWGGGPALALLAVTCSSLCVQEAEL